MLSVHLNSTLQPAMGRPSAKSVTLFRHQSRHLIDAAGPAFVSLQFDTTDGRRHVFGQVLGCTLQTHGRDFSARKRKISEKGMLWRQWCTGTLYVEIEASRSDRASRSEIQSLRVPERISLKSLRLETVNLAGRALSGQVAFEDGSSEAFSLSM
jgi:hypothetical protein